MTLPEATVRALVELAGKATKGPWWQGPHYKCDVGSREGSICEGFPFNTPRAIANAAYIAAADPTTIGKLLADWLAMRAELDGVRPPKPEVTGNIISVAWQPGYWRITKRADPFKWDEGDEQ